LSVVGLQRRGSLPADELKEKTIVLMADFFGLQRKGLFRQMN
jgi:hypothetical protein